MSENKLTKTISREIRNVNTLIDMKIIQGVPYKREAKRHKMLVSMLHDLEARNKALRPSMWLSSFLFN